MVLFIQDFFFKHLILGGNFESNSQSVWRALYIYLVCL